MNGIDFPVTFRRNNALARTLDRMPLDRYLHAIGATGSIYDLLRIAYVGEYGREANEQSSLNFITLVGTDTSNPDSFALYGTRDQRYKVLGGNDQIIKALAGQLVGQINPGHQLVSIRALGTAYRLTFERQAAGLLDVDADFVVMAIPFTTPREVAIRLPLPGYIDADPLRGGIGAWPPRAEPRRHTLACIDSRRNR